MPTLPDGYVLDPLVDVAPRHAPVPPGHEIVTGLTANGLPTALVVPAVDAPRFRRIAERAREDHADRRRLVEIFDSPDHVAEKAAILARVNEAPLARFAEIYEYRMENA